MAANKQKRCEVEKKLCPRAIRQALLSTYMCSFCVENFVGSGVRALKGRPANIPPQICDYMRELHKRRREDSRKPIKLR
jgi:hypothetical protein